MATQEQLVEHQVQLEKLFNKNQLMPRLRSEFENCEEFDFKAYFEANGVPGKFGIDVLAQMALRKRADFQTLVGCLRYHCKTAQEVADLIIKCAELDVIDYSGQLEIFIVKMEVSSDVQAELDRFQYPLPMVVEPRELTSNMSGGYLLTDSSVILKNNHHDDDVCLDHLNRMNKVKLQLNMDVATMIENSWSNLDKCKEGETRKDYEKRVRAFKKYDETARDVMAVLLHESDTFNLTHKYDKRGRTYCQGHHVTYQGNAWNKAIIEFADEEIVTTK